jgi:hypothetical protein
LLFQGADREKYPNDLAISSADIITSPVLTVVYEANNMKEYCSYDEFKNGLFILESSRDIELLDLEYQSKLADTRLTSVDRAKLEEEFQQKREALRVPQYKLNFMSPIGTRIPGPLMSKLLNDILATWAEQAVREKGVLTHQVHVYSANILMRELLEEDDYFIRVDILRENVNRIIGNIDELSKLPGATVIRVGQDQISLAEVRANLEDLRRFKVEPLLAVVRGTGLTPSSSVRNQYLENRLRQVRLEQQQAASRVAKLHEAFQTYVLQRSSIVAANASGGPAEAQSVPPATIPQLSESFLDRLVAISSQNSDLQFRQRLTE